MSGPLDLYLAPTGALDAAQLAVLADLLEARERARAARLPEGPVRRDFIAAHALVRLVLSRHRPARSPRAWRFEIAPHGKPSPVDAAGLAFNLSHAEGLVAVGVGEDMEVGVDVEPLAAAGKMERAAPVFCAPQERVALSRMEAAERSAVLLALWTIKESLLKAMGSGFTLSPQSISCALAPLQLVDGPWVAPAPHAFVASLAPEGVAPEGFQVAACGLCPVPPMLRVHLVERLGGELGVSCAPALTAAFAPVALARPGE